MTETTGGPDQIIAWAEWALSYADSIGPLNYSIIWSHD